ncbi:MAG TPA: amino acid permease, partial [Thermopetrobacter sp.]|nr:amino acid permease [Thermopetrobacter sp.]
IAGLLQHPADMAAALYHPPPLNASDAARVLSASLLAFFAFIGFEDMVTVAEETKDPGRTIGRAIVLTIMLTAVIYLGVYAAAAGTVSPEALAASHEPLALVARGLHGVPADAIAAIASFAVVNGILIQIIMASRILYGLTHAGVLPAVLGRVHARFRTPAPAIVLCWAIILVLALALPLMSLAGITSRIVLAVYALVCAALLLVKRRKEPAPEGTFRAPALIVAGGLVVCLFLLFAP